jgi:hypothetical protein
MLAESIVDDAEAVRRATDVIEASPRSIDEYSPGSRPASSGGSMANTAALHLAELSQQARHTTARPPGR